MKSYLLSQAQRSQVDEQVKEALKEEDEALETFKMAAQRLKDPHLRYEAQLLFGIAISEHQKFQPLADDFLQYSCDDGAWASCHKKDFDGFHETWSQSITNKRPSYPEGYLVRLMIDKLEKDFSKDLPIINGMKGNKPSFDILDNIYKSAKNFGVRKTLCIANTSLVDRVLRPSAGRSTDPNYRACDFTKSAKNKSESKDIRSLTPQEIKKAGLVRSKDGLLKPVPTSGPPIKKKAAKKSKLVTVKAEESASKALKAALIAGHNAAAPSDPTSAPKSHVDTWLGYGAGKTGMDAPKWSLDKPSRDLPVKAELTFGTKRKATEVTIKNEAQNERPETSPPNTPLPPSNKRPKADRIQTPQSESSGAPWSSDHSAQKPVQVDKSSTSPQPCTCPPFTASLKASLDIAASKSGGKAAKARAVSLLTSYQDVRAAQGSPCLEHCKKLLAALGLASEVDIGTAIQRLDTCCANKSWMFPGA